MVGPFPVDQAQEELLEFLVLVFVFEVKLKLPIVNVRCNMDNNYLDSDYWRISRIIWWYITEYDGILVVVLL